MNDKNKMVIVGVVAVIAVLFAIIAFKKGVLDTGKVDDNGIKGEVSKAVDKTSGAAAPEGADKPQSGSLPMPGGKRSH